MGTKEISSPIARLLYLLPTFKCSRRKCSAQIGNDVLGALGDIKVT